MIAISNQPLEPQAVTLQALTDARRSRFWGRWMSVATSLPAALIAASAAAPSGHFYVLWILAAVLVLCELPVLLVAGAGALFRARRAPHPLTRSALFWWLLPFGMLLAATLLARTTAMRDLGFSLARGDLLSLGQESAALSADQVALPRRWVGPWLLDEIRRYPDGALRATVLGSESPAGKRGLYYSPSGDPVRLEAPAGAWRPDRIEPLGAGWFTWYRTEAR